MSERSQVRPRHPFRDMPVCVIDDCKEHVEQDEEAAEDVENEEPGTLGWHKVEMYIDLSTSCEHITYAIYSLYP